MISRHLDPVWADGIPSRSPSRVVHDRIMVAIARASYVVRGTIHGSFERCLAEAKLRVAERLIPGDDPRKTSIALLRGALNEDLR